MVNNRLVSHPPRYFTVRFPSNHWIGGGVRELCVDAFRAIRYEQAGPRQV
jgi:hypothetical protein